MAASLKACSNSASRACCRLMPAAIAWPPKRSIRPGLAASTRASASRMWKPGIERAEPRSMSLPGSPGANATTGRCRRSFIFDATRPITPGCQSASNRQCAMRGAAAESGSEASALSASPTICCCTARRSALMPSSTCASSRACPGSSQSRHSMPSAMSSRRPAALRRGATENPMSLAVSVAACRRETSINACRPAQPCPARRRRRPADTSARLLASSGTRSATVPTATRSSSTPRSGRVIGEAARFAQALAQRQQHVEHHPDAGQHLAGEGVAALVGIDDGVRRRQRVAGQMVIGDQHLPAMRLCRRDAGVAGDAVVDGDQQVGLQRGEFLDQCRRQAVAVDHAIRHRVRHARRAQHAQPAHADRAGGGAVAIEVADDQDVAIVPRSHRPAMRWRHRGRAGRRAAAGWRGAAARSRDRARRAPRRCAAGSAAPMPASRRRRCIRGAGSCARRVMRPAAAAACARSASAGRA